MKKSTRVMVAVSVRLAMLALCAGSARTEDRPGFETYVVRSGDTLSKISGRVFGDASAKLAELLPGVVDKLTPNGQIPDAGGLSDLLGSLTKRIG